MPAAAPPSFHHLRKSLRQLGQHICLRRKLLKISAVVTAEAAGISRMTLSRIERGEPSVTMGAYLTVISALGLELRAEDPKTREKISSLQLPEKIRLADFPQLKALAWQLEDNTELTAKEALGLYERNWRHLERGKLTKRELQLIESLLAKLGRSDLLV